MRGDGCTALQQEPGTSSAAGERIISNTDVSNIASVNNIALFANCLSQMLQFLSTNIAVASSAVPRVTAPPSVTDPVNTFGNTSNPVMVTSGNYTAPLVNPVNVDGGSSSAPVDMVNITVPPFNVSAVWAGNSGLTAISSVLLNASEGASIVKGLGIAEAYFKEAMTCEMSPLGFHLTPTIKENIWRKEFIDILSLLPSASHTLTDRARRPAGHIYSRWPRGL